MSHFWMSSAIKQLTFLVIVFGFVKCLTIDNKLNIIRSDCYERLAIGQKLHKRDIDKSLNLSTVQECQFACTQEDRNCRTFSFGIGLKGNSTCELSKHVVKESADLTPIGTVANLDFDLYIKKLGCKLVLTQDPQKNQPKPQESSSNANEKQNTTYSTKINIDKVPTSTQTNQYLYQDDEKNPPQSLDSDEPMRVQSSLISIASGPGTLSHISSPVHENANKKPPTDYGTGKPYYPNRFRPNYDSTNNSPYDRPAYHSDSYDYYAKPTNNYEPQKPAYLSDRFGYEGFSSHSSSGYESSSNSHVNYNSYDDQQQYYQDDNKRPQTVPDRPYSSDSYYEPNNLKPQRPNVVYYYDDKHQLYLPHNLPYRPMENDYMYGSRPKPPQQAIDNKQPEIVKGNNSDPYQQNLNKPTEIPKPPKPDLTSYPDQSNSNKPIIIPNSPANNPDSYDQKPMRPSTIPERPINNGNYNGYQPNRPDYGYEDNISYDEIFDHIFEKRNQSYIIRPIYQQEIPIDDKPYRPSKLPDIFSSYDQTHTSSKPQKIPARPINQDPYGLDLNEQSSRPVKIPGPPLNGYESSVVHERPQKIPARPINQDPYGLDLNEQSSRPVKIPGGPPLNGYESSVVHERPQKIPTRPIHQDPYGSDLNEQSSRPVNIPSRPLNGYEPSVSHEKPHDRPHRPHDYPQRPHDYPQRPYDYPQRPHDYQQRPYDYPQRPYDYSQRPYDYPQRPFDYPQRPHDYQGSYDYLHRPDDIPDRPISSSRPIETSYGTRPHRPVKIPETPVDSYGQAIDSHRPHETPSRPQIRPVEVNYGSSISAGSNRPTKIPEVPSSNFDNSYGPTMSHKPQDIPSRPQKVPNRPTEPNNYGSQSDSHRPTKIPIRPSNNYDNYESPTRPHSSYDIPSRPQKKPSHSHTELNYGGSGSQKPSKIPESPIDNYGSIKPHRPYDMENRPQKRPSRPTEDNSYNSGLSSNSYRPSKIPDSPLSGTADGYGQPQRPYDVTSRPQKFPNRPINNDNHYGSGIESNRPTKIPSFPTNTIDSNLNNIYFTVHTQKPPYYYNDRYDRPIYDDFDSTASYKDRYDIPFKRPVSYYDNDFRRDPYKRPNNDMNRHDNSYSSENADFDYYNRRPVSYSPLEDRDYDYYRYKYRPYEQDYNQRHDYILPWDYRFDHEKSYYASRYPFKDIYNDPYYRRAIYSTEFQRPVYVPVFTKNVYSNSTSQNSNDIKNSTVAEVSNVTSIENATKPSTSVSKPENGFKNHIRRPIVSERIGAHGETITSIITEITDKFESCFRRVLAGKRVIDSLVRKAVLCERVEDCQRECSEEKRFVCEGFNYRLDPSGRSQGECELLDYPLSRLDIRRDVYSDPEYDFYERDRNSDAPDCIGVRSSVTYRDGGTSLDRRYNYYDEHKSKDYYDDFRRDDNAYDYEYRQQLQPDVYDDRYDSYDGGNRRGGKNYNHEGSYGHGKNYHDKYYYEKNKFNDDSYGHHYAKPIPSDNDYYYKSIYPDRPYDYKSYEPYLPRGYWKYERPYYDSNQQWDKYFHDRASDKNHWGFNKETGSWGNYGGAYGNFGAPDSYYHYDYYNHKNYNRHDYNNYEKKYFFAPDNYGGSKDWGHYGGTYGYEDQNKHRESYDYWGLNNVPSGNGVDNHNVAPQQPHYPPSYNHNVSSYGTYEHNYQDVLKDECSLRMVTGFKLHKGIIKKLTSVSSIYECELLCYKEREFTCSSYAFRYTSIPGSSLENCYLSDRDYKELDYYTDLEPDRDCDVYRMHNQQRCDQPSNKNKDGSECFWRVRSSQRLDHAVVRDSLNVKSIVECQVQCLQSPRFTCRAFSFRYGPPTIGGAIDNCQLTDRSFLDLNPLLHVVPEHGFELYERGSYGHGCEPNHFQIGTKPSEPPGDKIDQICYIGYNTPARLLTQATKKSVRVNTEEECKEECTRAKKSSLFQCMSLSYRTAVPKDVLNCDLSDIVQRDLLSNVDYVEENDSWLFAWDIHNPRCAVYSIIGIGSIGGHNNGIGGIGSHHNHGIGIIDHNHGTGDHNHGIGDHSHGIGDHSHGIGNHIHGIGDYNGIGGNDGHENHGKEIIPWIDPTDSYNTWKIYSVGGLPCKRGSLCKENKVAGFWYCELEGREEHAWDYCCRPDHQCGYSEGFDYQWCYVGPERTQWRKCNDHYYPYISTHSHAGFQTLHPVSSNNQQWASTNSINSIYKPHSYRPNKPPPHPQQPTLIDYESQLNDQYLDPPVPGGFGPSRHWPISYLHKEAPPNDTFINSKVSYRSTTNDKSSGLINNNPKSTESVKSNDLKDTKSFLNNVQNKSEETLFVRIPLPTDNTDRIQKTRSTEGIKDQSKPNTVWTDVTSNNPNINPDNKNSQNYTRSYVTRMDKVLNSQQQRRARITKGIVEAVPPP